MAEPVGLLQQIDPEVEMLRLNKESGYNYRQRRQDDWLENYTLSRDKVTINRLTQRQSVNIPMMKTVLRTILKEVDDMPVMYFENLDNDKQAEIFQNEYWTITGDENKFELQDIVDKKQILSFGRTFDQWQIVDGKIKMVVQDPQDLLVSRYTDPFNLHTSRFLTHTHIFVPLSYLETNSDYDQREVADLKRWFASEQGIIKSASNLTMMVEKNQKMAEMGVPDVDSPVLGETYVELSLNFVFRNKETRKGQEFKDQIFLYVDAENMKILMKKPLEEVIGTTQDNFWQKTYPYNSWADDLERQDFWSDGVADIVRTPNKVLNSWFSQMVENRTMRNFGMHYYNSSVEGFTPSTFNPIPWGWYGVPGKPSDVLQKVDIPDLSESLDEMNFLITMVEKASGATATQQGVQTQRKITLGEVELALAEAKERAKGMSKFYTQVWKERGLMFLKLIEAGSNKLDAVKIYKKGKSTDQIFSREIAPKDWMTQSGYRVKIWNQDERNAKNTQNLEKMSAVKANMPDNPKVDEVYKRKLVEFADFTPEEINDVMSFEQTKREMLASNPMMGGMVGQPGQQMPQQQSQVPVMPNQITQ